jgi:hypothetical protein
MRFLTNCQASELDNYQTAANQLQGYQVRQEAFGAGNNRLQNYCSLWSENADCSDFWELIKEIRQAKSPENIGDCFLKIRKITSLDNHSNGNT